MIESESQATSAAPPPSGQVLVDRILTEAVAADEISLALSQLPSGRRLMESPSEVQVEALVHALTLAKEVGSRNQTTFTYADLSRSDATRKVISAMLRKHPVLSEEQLISTLRLAARVDHSSSQIPIAGLLRAIETSCPAESRSEALTRALVSLLEVVKQREKYSSKKPVTHRLNALLGRKRATERVLMPGDAWSDAALTMLASMNDLDRDAWTALLRHCATATNTAPSKSWMIAARERLEPIDKGAFSTSCSAWLGLIGKPRNTSSCKDGRNPPGDTLLMAANTDTLRGIVWSASLRHSPGMLRAVGIAAEASFKKVPGFGPLCAKVGNACLYYLGAQSDEASAAELVRLQECVKHPSTRRLVEKAVRHAAFARGMSPEDLSELAVPTMGLSAASVLTRTIGGHVAELRVAGAARVSLSWSSPTGRTIRSTPKAAREEDPTGVKELIHAQRDMQRTLQGIRDRLERLLMVERSWPTAQWIDRYATQPALSHMTARLIWRFRTGERSETGLWRDGAAIGVSGSPLNAPSENTRVSLWHPIESAAEEVLAWRSALESQQICQPFKQAHREVYRLTDAERRTETYSNRFAAHILRQHQMAALCQERGWRYRLSGVFDNGGLVPTRELPVVGLRAMFLVDPIIDEDGVSDAGVSLHVTTDQVAFFALDNDERIPLDRIPALVLSEVMRDVDLFVGVCSVGNNPQWQDGGPDGVHREYWQNYSFGDLTEAGRGRQDILSRLLPRLKIAGKCSLGEKFLTVRGALRTYKIHLGSGNILMEPNDQYLCIVPSSSQEARVGGAGGQVFLPFEGDRTLAIILSKAFMLAEDEKITDTSITRQIRER